MSNKGYLFVHFIGENEIGEQVYFSISKDGLHWEDLNKGEPVLMNNLGEKGARDPFIIRSVDGEKYYIIATDLRIASGKGWKSAVNEGSRNLIVWESEDLVNWSEERMVEVGIEGAGCVWAPEAIYDKETGKYFVFWASHVKEEGEENPKHRIYCSYTSDFKTFTKAEKYIERDNHVIDTTIIENAGVYYRFSKDETTKNIRIDKANKLIGEPFQDVKMPQVEALTGVEGPEIFKFNDREEWCLIVDQFATGKGYLPMVTNDLNGDFRVLNSSEYDMGITKKRHGSVISLNEEEYESIIQKWKVTGEK
jgi:hypothetical protein